jgi:hypothetical protein
MTVTTFKWLLTIGDKGSISSTFYTRLFSTKVSRKAFLCLKYRLNFLLTQGNWRNCALKMLVKLTQGLTTQLYLI